MTAFAYAAPTSVSEVLTLLMTIRVAVNLLRFWLVAPM